MTHSAFPGLSVIFTASVDRSLMEGSNSFWIRRLERQMNSGNVVIRQVHEQLVGVEETRTFVQDPGMPKRITNLPR